MISGKGITGDTTASRALKLASDQSIRYLKDAVWSVECAFDDYSNDQRIDNIRKIIKLTYWDQTHTALGAALEVGYSESQVRRIRAKFVKHVIAYLGW